MNELRKLRTIILDALSTRDLEIKLNKVIEEVERHNGYVSIIQYQAETIRYKNTNDYIPEYSVLVGYECEEDIIRFKDSLRY